jgi:hypothetical protein
LEIPSCLWINIWLIKISWPCIFPWILPPSIAPQVHKCFCNMSSHGIVHYKLTLQPAHMAHLNSLEFIFIHCNIFWLSFSLNIFFFIGFSTYLL